MHFKKLIICVIATYCLFAAPISYAYADNAPQDQYAQEREQDQKQIDYINSHMDQLLREGREYAKNDAKSGEPVFNDDDALGSSGDILVSLILDSGSSGLAGHAALVSKNRAITIESYLKLFSPIKKDGVQYYQNLWWQKKGAMLIRPKGASVAQFDKAANYAERQVGKPYNLTFTDKNTTSSFYCSQLVWKAWLYAGIDCEVGSIPNAIISPSDLVNPTNTYIVRKV